MSTLAAKIDDIGKPAWIGLMVIGFIFWWPFGLAMLAFLIGSGRIGGHRMGCWKSGFTDRVQREFRDFTGGRGSSGNAAFDEYREETLKRLEEEQREFKDFLTRLRQAKDKAEFDQFMSDRRGRRDAPGRDDQVGSRDASGANAQA